MRLVCPNCDAEYEVDAAEIPDGGRDVQCSNCGHAWFQLSPEVEAELAAEEALFIDDREDNIAGAESVGIAGYVFVDESGTRAWLRGQGVAVR